MDDLRSSLEGRGPHCWFLQRYITVYRGATVSVRSIRGDEIWFVQSIVRTVVNKKDSNTLFRYRLGL